MSFIGKPKPMDNIIDTFIRVLQLFCRPLQPYPPKIGRIIFSGHTHQETVQIIRIEMKERGKARPVHIGKMVLHILQYFSHQVLLNLTSALIMADVIMVFRQQPEQTDQISFYHQMMPRKLPFILFHNLLQKSLHRCKIIPPEPDILLIRAAVLVSINAAISG